LRKEVEDKKVVMGWSVENLGRVFREIYTGFNWSRVVDNFGEIEEEQLPEEVGERGMELKEF